MDVMEFPLTLAAVEAWNLPGFESIITGLGEYPDAVLDFNNINFTRSGVYIAIAAYRNEANWEADIPLPFPLITLQLTLAPFILGDSTTVEDLNNSVRSAAWWLAMTHPDMPGGIDMISAGTLVPVSA